MSLTNLLNNSTIEIFPDSNIESKIADANLKPRTRLAIATHDMHKTHDLVKAISEKYWDKYILIPHIQARAIENDNELYKILNTYWDYGIKEIYVVGGDIDDKEVRGYASTYSLIFDIKKWEKSTENKFMIGIAGYPEGHYKISDEELISALKYKQPFADYIVTQMSLNSGKVISWLKFIREKGINLPVRVLVPAENDQDKLMKTIKKVDIKTTWRYLSHNIYQGQLFVSDFIANNLAKVPVLGRLTNYIPLYSRDKFIKDIYPYSESLNIIGFHIFSANQIEKTNRWIDTLNK